jgi:hypothetical protein
MLALENATDIMLTTARDVRKFVVNVQVNAEEWLGKWSKH